MFGVGLSASYQKRDFGSSTATVNDWHIQAWDADNMAANISAGPLFAQNGLNPNDNGVNLNVENAPAERPALRHPERHPLRVLGLRARAHQRAVDGAVRADRIADPDCRTYTFAEQDITEDRGEQTIWLQRNGFDHIDFRYGRSSCDPGPSARVHGLGQGLRLRAAASRAEERPEFGRLQRDLGCHRQLQSRLRLPQFARAQLAG